MSLYFRQLYALSKRETSYGVDPSPAAADALLLRNVNIDTLAGQAVSRDLVLAFMGADPAVMVGVHRKMDFEIELAGAGTPGAIPAYSSLLRSAAMAETLVAAGTIQASPATSVGTPTGTFTYTNTGTYTGAASRLVTLLCTTAGGTGVAKFTVSSPAGYGLSAVNTTNVTMTNATPFALANGATITPTIGTAFALNDSYTIQLDPARVEYTPVTSLMDSTAIYLGINDQLRTLLGARGRIDLTLAALKVPFFKWSGAGLWSAPLTSGPTTPNYTAWKDPSVVSKDSSTITIQGFSALVNSLSLSSNADYGYVERIGVGKVEIGDRPWSGSIDFELPTIAAFDIETIAKNATTGALKVVHGYAGGNIIQVDAPKVQLMEPKFAKGDKGIWMCSAKIILLPVTGNDEVKLTVK